jgi:proteasome lid subunit RPN8/RPN11
MGVEDAGEMLRMARATFLQIREQGERSYPEESCGVLLGRMAGGDRTVTRAIPARNLRVDSARNRYEIGASDLIAAEREARRSGEEIVGFYHSHPDHPARWSRVDLAEAHWLGCSYLITQVDEGRANESRSFFLAGENEEDKRFLVEEIEIAG